MMTLAFTGKSGKHRALLIVAAFLALMVALAAAAAGQGSASADRPPPTGTIQVHKYLPKDNPGGENVPWQNQGNSTDWTFNVYSDAALTQLVDTFTQLGPPGKDFPQTDLWITEAPRAGYEFAGFYVPDGDNDSGNDKCNQQPANGATLTASPLHIAASMWTTKGNHTGLLHVCAYNRPAVGAIRIVKIDNTLSGDATRPAQWNFNVSGAASYNRQIALGGGQVLIPDVPLGTYAVTEAQARLLAQCPDMPNLGQQGYFTTVVNTDNTVNSPGEAIVWTFTNQPCPTEAAAPNLTVRKVIDINGDGDQDPEDTLANGWTITVTCGAQLLTEVTGSDGAGTSFFPGTPPGNCTVAETEQAGYNSIVKFTKTDGGNTTSGPGSQLPITQDINENNLVTFFNQPLGQAVGSIRVNKTTLRNNGLEVAENGGWKVTISSVACSVSATAKWTGQGNPKGTVLFDTLPVCSDYVVSEDPNSKSGASPAWAAAGATSYTVAVTAGNQTVVEFTNQRFDPSIPEPTPPSPTVPVSPSPTLIAPPPEVTQVAGERTPGAVEATPIAPSAGTGARGAGSSNAMPILVLGAALILAGSGFSTALALRSARR